MSVNINLFDSFNSSTNVVSYTNASVKNTYTVTSEGYYQPRIRGTSGNTNPAAITLNGAVTIVTTPIEIDIPVYGPILHLKAGDVFTVTQNSVLSTSAYIAWGVTKLEK